MCSVLQRFHAFNYKKKKHISNPNESVCVGDELILWTPRSSGCWAGRRAPSEPGWRGCGQHLQWGLCVRRGTEVSSSHKFLSTLDLSTGFVNLETMTQMRGRMCALVRHLPRFPARGAFRLPSPNASECPLLFWFSRFACLPSEPSLSPLSPSPDPSAHSPCIQYWRGWGGHG